MGRAGPVGGQSGNCGLLDARRRKQGAADGALGDRVDRKGGSSTLPGLLFPSALPLMAALSVSLLTKSSVSFSL